MCQTGCSHSYFRLAISYMPGHRSTLTACANSSSTNKAQHNLMCGWMTSVCARKLARFPFSRWENHSPCPFIMPSFAILSISSRSVRWLINTELELNIKHSYSSQISPHTRTYLQSSMIRWQRCSKRHSCHQIRSNVEVTGDDSCDVGVRLD